MDKNIVIINGLALDKPLFKQILERISKDNHLCFAIKFLKNMWKDEKPVKNLDKINKYFENTMEIASTLLHAVPAMPVVERFSKLISHCIGLYKDSHTLKLPEKFKITDFGDSNFKYFNLFLSHLSDTPIFNAILYYYISNFFEDDFLNEDNNNVKLLNNFNKFLSSQRIIQMYCDKPYYENKYIDAIEISFKKDINNPKTNEHQIIDIIKKHILLILLRNVIIQEIEKELKDLETRGGDLRAFDDAKLHVLTVLRERGLYGLWLLSDILHTLYGQAEIICEFSKNLIENTGSLKADGAFARECLLLAGNPGKMIFRPAVNNPQENCVIRIQKIDHETSQSSIDWKKVDFSNLSRLFRPQQEKESGFFSFIIPIKKVISLPCSSYKKISSLGRIPQPVEKDLLPIPHIRDIDVSSKNDDQGKITWECEAGKELEIFCLGGGEHNNPLVHIVNTLRYLDGPSARRFGFIENAFDRELRKTSNNEFPQFQLGLETFVSGINAIIRGRETVEAPTSPGAVDWSSNGAEILKIDLGKSIQGFAIHGFSAPATRLTLLGLLYSRIKGNKVFFEDSNRLNSIKGLQRVEVYSNFEERQAKFYRFCESKGEFWQLLGKFDFYDIMNNPDDELLRKLLINNFYVIHKN